MAKPSRLDQLVRTVTKDVIAHPRDLTRFYVEKLNVSRVSANKYVQQLEADGWIARSGPATHPVFSLGYKRRRMGLYKLAGLEEHTVWARDFRPYFSLPANIQQIAEHGFTEILNNAIDHSGGASAFIWIDQDDNSLTIIISDDGIGIFKKITDALELPDIRQSLFELSKGKLTTDPSRHTGEGVFFTTRMFDTFEIHANDLAFNHRDSSTRDFLKEERGDTLDGGTNVYMSIALDSTRTINDVYEQFTNAPEGFDFSKTIVPMKLAKIGDEQLVSRSQAKRLIARFDKFKAVVLDFDGVRDIGQAFADEIFRVYALLHPEVELIPKNMSRQVERMYLRAITANPATP
ncbi:hypothetical protein CDEF62S_01624 [Castellaniella defragrans]